MLEYIAMIVAVIVIATLFFVGLFIMFLGFALAIEYFAVWWVEIVEDAKENDGEV